MASKKQRKKRDGARVRQGARISPAMLLLAAAIVAGGAWWWVRSRPAAPALTRRLRQPANVDTATRDDRDNRE